MVQGTLIIAALNILIGLLIIIFPGLLRVLIGGYFILAGILMLLFAYGGL